MIFPRFLDGKLSYETRPDAGQNSRGRFGRGRNAKKCSQFKNGTHQPTWEGVKSRARD